METMEVTKEERDLIETLRNYRRAYPNGSQTMDWEIQDLVMFLKGEK